MRVRDREGNEFEVYDWVEYIADLIAAGLFAEAEEELRDLWRREEDYWTARRAQNA